MNARSLAIVFSPNLFDITMNEFTIVNSKKVFCLMLILGALLIVINRL
jgi:hypothetical protein